MGGSTRRTSWRERARSGANAAGRLIGRWFRPGIPRPPASRAWRLPRLRRTPPRPSCSAGLPGNADLRSQLACCEPAAGRRPPQPTPSAPHAITSQRSTLTASRLGLVPGHLPRRASEKRTGRAAWRVEQALSRPGGMSDREDWPGAESRCTCVAALHPGNARLGPSKLASLSAKFAIGRGRPAAGPARPGPAAPAWPRLERRNPPLTELQRAIELTIRRLATSARFRACRY